MKKALLALILALLLAASGLPMSCFPNDDGGEDGAGPVEGETIEAGGFTVTIGTPEVDFPESMGFRVQVEGGAEITGLSLQYRMERMGIFPVTSVVFPDFAPGEKTTAAWTWNMDQTGGLPPGADLTYWWTIEDSSGRRADTPARTASFDDSRHEWRELAGSGFTLYWYQGDDGFAGQLVDAGEEALELLSEDIGAAPERAIEVYIYGSTGELQGSLIYPDEWTGGVAFTEYSIVALGISSGDLEWGLGAMAHEMAHLVVHQVTMNGYGVSLPTWLDEGLAMYAEGPLASGFASVLSSAVSQNRLDSVQSLSSSFPAGTEAAYLAYAESYSLVDYLLERRGGQERMLEYLSAIRGGSGHEEALRAVYGLTPATLDAQWKSYLAAGGRLAMGRSRAAGRCCLSLGLVLLALLCLGNTCWETTTSKLSVPDRDTLVLADSDPSTLDPALAREVGSVSYIMQIFSGLVTFDAGMNLVPDIAEGWETDGTGTVFTFHLREDAVFHDGRLVTAADFRYSWERAGDPATVSRPPGPT